MSTRLARFRRWSLSIAETIDAYRVIPRLLLIAYGYLVWNLAVWFMSIPTTTQINCEAPVLEALLDRGFDLERARGTACSVVSSVGGPTPEQTTFVSIIIGLSSAIIGLYMSTGTRSKWQGDILGKMEGTIEVNPGGDIPAQHPHHGQPQYPPQYAQQPRQGQYQPPGNRNPTQQPTAWGSPDLPDEWSVGSDALPDLREEEYQG